jgi:hypothetical protein
MGEKYTPYAASSAEKVKISAIASAAMSSLKTERLISMLVQATPNAMPTNATHCQNGCSGNWPYKPKMRAIAASKGRSQPEKKIRPRRTLTWTPNISVNLNARDTVR